MDGMGNTSSNLNSLVTSTPMSYALPLMAAVGAAASPAIARGVGGLMTAMNLGTNLFEKRQQQQRLSDASKNLVDAGVLSSPAQKVLTATGGAPELVPQTINFATGTMEPHRNIMRTDTGDVYETLTPKLDSGPTRLSQVGQVNTRPDASQMAFAEQTGKFPQTPEEWGQANAATKSQEIGQYKQKSDIGFQHDLAKQQNMIDAHFETQRRSFDQQQNMFNQQYDKWEQGQYNTEARQIGQQVSAAQAQMMNQVKALNAERQKAITTMSTNPMAMVDIKKQYPGVDAAKARQMALQQLNSDYDNKVNGVIDDFKALNQPRIEQYKLPVVDYDILKKHGSGPIMPQPTQPQSSAPSKRRGVVVTRPGDGPVTVQW